ncbi:hypothetical protein [Microbacterium paraoxydans]|uniref:hypothetical protein n=1 Tax=Microbacterium paraoxydans TaxID=199592 RepID=UPI003D74DFDC
MSVVLLAVTQPRADELVAELEWEGVSALSLPSASASAIIARLQPDVEAVVTPATRAVLTPELLSACDRAGVRIVTLGGTDSRAVMRMGLAPPLRTDAPGWEVAAALSTDVRRPIAGAHRGRRPVSRPSGARTERQDAPRSPFSSPWNSRGADAGRR